MRRPLFTAAVAVLSLAACRAKKENTAPIQTAPVERRDIVVEAEATGTVEPINLVEVKSKASGIVTRMTVETGSQVRQGELLVQVDTRDVQNQYDQALADVRAAEARLDISRAQKRRADELHAQRVITAQEHEAASLDFANAQAQLVRARTSLDLAKQRLEDATVTAPVAGTIIERSVSPGQVITSATGSVTGGTTLLKMANLERVRVRALFNETDIGQVKAGQVATVIVDAYPDRTFRGVVEKIEPQAVVQQSVTMFPVLVTIDNREGLLKPGMNGETSVLVDRRDDVLSIPNDAVRSMREAATAAQILGLNADSVAAQVRAQTAQMRGPGGPSDAPAATPVPAGGARTEVSRGEVDLQDRQGSRQGGGRQGGMRLPEASAGGAAGGRTAQAAGAPGTGGPAMGGGRRARPALVFVAKNGTYEPRVVRTGVSNYDYIEVVSGLQEGEQVALLAAATMQLQRQERTERMRGMAGGGFTNNQPGGAGGGGGRRGPQ